MRPPCRLTLLLDALSIPRSSWYRTPIPDEDWSSGQQGLCQAVAEACAEGRDSAADGALGLEVTRCVYAAYVSAAEGRRVSLSELEEAS